MKKLIISFLIFVFLIQGCSQKTTSIDDKEIKCEGTVSVISKSNPESNIQWNKIITINFNIRNSKIFSPFDLIYISIPRDGIQCHLEDEETVCNFSTKTPSEHTISINLRKNEAIKVVETTMEKNKDQKVTFTGTCDEVNY